MESYFVPDRRLADAKVRVIGKQRLAALCHFTCSRPAVAARACLIAYEYSLLKREDPEGADFFSF